MKRLSVLLVLILLLGILPSNISPASAEEAELIFELTEEEVDSFLESAEEHKFLRPSSRDGRPVYAKPGSGGISISARDQDWQSLDIRSDWMEPGWTYNITVEFQSSEETHFIITNTDPPYAARLSITDAPTTNAVLTYEMGIQNYTDGQRGVRLMTYPQSSIVNYTVKSIFIYKGEYNENAAPASWATDIPSLCGTYSAYFPVGNIMEPAQVDNADIAAMFLHQYNAVTAENSMKPEGIAPQKGQYNFDGADKLVNWATENGVEVHGHTLVWHSQSARWLTTGDDGEPLARSEAQANMKEFITRYAGRYAGKVKSWDVVNEAFNDSTRSSGTWRDELRKNSPWYKAYANGMDEAAGEAPEDYIYDAFVFAREAAPDALLVYNDFNEESKNKRESIATMVEDLNSKWLSDDRNTDKDRLLIEVIGMQAHYWTGYLNPEDVRDSIERFIETGAQVAVTELDIPTGVYGSFGGDDEELLQLQADLYADLFEIYMEYSEHILRVTFWGKADHHSWRSEGFPVLFDKDLQPKSAFWRIIEVVKPFEPIAPPEPAPIDPVQPGQTGDGSDIPAGETQPPSDSDSSNRVIWIVTGGLILLVLIIIPVVLRSRKKKA